MAKPKLALIPAAQGDKFYSVLPSDGVGDFTFSRGSSATRINAQGLIETVADTSSRLDYDLLNGKVVNCPHYLLEPQRSNLFTNSEDFSTNWSVSNVLVNVNQIISPNGTLNADLVYENTGTNPHFIFQTVGTTTTNDYTISVFAKYSGRFLQVFVGGSDAVGNPYVNFDLQNGTFNNNGANGVSMENYGNGWYRCSVEVTSAVTSGFNPIFGLVKTLNSSRASSYTGDGTSGFYIFGAQVEEGSYPTSYIPTTTTTITRAAETADGSGNAATFNDSEGVLMAEISALDLLSDVSRPILLTSSDGLNYVNIYWQSNGVLTVFNNVNGVNTVLFQETLNDITTFHKASLKWSSQGYELWVNGLKLANSTNTSVPTGLSELMFNWYGNIRYFHGKTREVQYFDSALTDAQLETLTSWTSLQEMITSQLYTNY